jgi:hypothetical protein
MAHLGEFELIRRFFARAPVHAQERSGVELGIGDDAAVLRIADGEDIVAAIDTIVAGRHFPAGSDARSIGHRALAVNCPRKSASTSSSTRSAAAAPASCTCRTIPYYGRDVAIKVYNIDTGGDENRKRIARKMFLSEAHMVGMLQHPNILPIYDAGEENGHCYIVTEHVHGARTLAAYCRPDNLLRIDDVVELMYKARGAALRAQPRRHPPRHQAEQHHAHARQRRAHHRFRHRAGRRLGYLAHRGHRRQPLLHVARAGAVDRADQPLGPVFARRGDVRAADRHAAVPRRQPAEAAAPDRVRDAAADPHAAPRHARGTRERHRHGAAEGSGASATRPASISPPN